MIRRTIAAVMICAGTAASAGAQWVHHPAPGIPRTKDGKPNLTAATPKGANGKPDLSGIWSTDPTPFEEMERLFPFFKAFAVPGDDPRMFTKYFMDVFADVRPEDVPMRPEAAQLFKQRMAAVDSAREAPARPAPTAALVLASRSCGISPSCTAERSARRTMRLRPARRFTSCCRRART